MDKRDITGHCRCGRELFHKRKLCIRCQIGDAVERLGLQKVRVR